MNLKNILSLRGDSHKNFYKNDVLNKIYADKILQIN